MAIVACDRPAPEAVGAVKPPLSDADGKLPLRIRETTQADLAEMMRIHREAFGQSQEAKLTAAILADPTAQPTLSLLAENDGTAVGHILFSKARLSAQDGDCPAALLAPLAVATPAQGRGVGGELVRAGLDRLRAAGIGLVFVLGNPRYYSRFGFAAAGAQGIQAPYPIPEEDAEAWRVQALRDGLLGQVHGTVVCCEALMQPELWRE